MREILFRGKRTDNKEWIYGSLVAMSNNVSYGDCKVFSNLHIIENIEIDIRSFLGGCCTLIDNDIIQIHKDTVGQYIGVKDSCENRIFDGDILLIDGGIGVIIWDSHSMRWGLESPGSCAVDFPMKDDYNRSKIIGNIHDNKELLGNDR